MLAIKLQRIGKKHQPSYRLVVVEKRSKLPGPPVEDLGSYNPATKVLETKKERVAYWIKVGAQPTVSTHNLLVKARVLLVSKKTVKIGAPKKQAVEAGAALPANETAAV